MDNFNYTLTVDALNDNLAQVIDFIDKILDDLNCTPKAQMQIDLSAEEIFVNIANYAYGDKVGQAEICVETREDEISLTFKDSGIPYNPLEKDDPDTALTADERQIGGLGIFLVKKNMDDVLYEYKDNRNILTLKKKI